jgi:pimeloyl-ACP methyl ester carboxylesterase
MIENQETTNHSRDKTGSWEVKTMVHKGTENGKVQYVLIHGLGQNSSSWSKTVSFMPKDICFYSPDLSVILRHKEVTYENLYHAFSDYCNSIQDELNLCGLSLGAVLALHYTIEHPEKVQTLVLIAAQYKMPKVLLKLQNVMIRFVPKGTFTSLGFQKNDFIKLTSSMAELDFSDRLEDIQCPTLIVCGEKDKANKQASQDLAENIPNSILHLIENTGHEVNIEAPEKLGTILCAQYVGK